MDLKTAVFRTGGVLAALGMLAASAGLVWAAATDYAVRNVVPAGVTVSGVELGGLVPAQVRDAIENTVVEPLLAPVRVTAGEQTFEVDPADFLHADLERAVAEAFEPNRTATIADRVYRQLLEEPVRVEIEPEIVVEESAIATRVAEFAAVVDAPAVDAWQAIEEGVFVVSPSAEGRRLDREAATALLAEAILAGDQAVALPMTPVAPAISEADLPRALVLRRSTRSLELWDAGELDRAYLVSIGAPAYGTPRGTWKITEKRYMPTWGNPGSAWAVNMPKSIGPGVYNPLGTRALNLDAPYIRIHGTPPGSPMGLASSHGCIRMTRANVEELYDLVEVGTPVFVVER